jgi:hypothetical protein
MNYNGSTYAHFGGANQHQADSYDFSAFGGGGGFANPQGNYGYSNPMPQSPPPYTPSYAGDFNSYQQHQAPQQQQQQQQPPIPGMTPSDMRAMLATINPALAASLSPPQPQQQSWQPHQRKLDPYLVPDAATMWRELVQLQADAAAERARRDAEADLFRNELFTRDLRIASLQVEMQTKDGQISHMQSIIQNLTQEKDYLMAQVEDHGNAIATIQQGGQAMYDNLDHRMEVQGRLMKGLSFRVGDVEENMAAMGSNNGSWRRAWSSSPLLRLTAPPSAATSSSGNVKKSSSSTSKPLLLLPAPPAAALVPPTPLACGAAAGFDASSSSSSSSCSSSPRSAAASESEAGCSAAEATINSTIDNKTSCSTPTAAIDDTSVASTSGLSISPPLLGVLSVPSALNALAAPASSSASSSSRSLLKMGLFAAVYAVRLALDVRRVGVKAVIANAIISLASG